MFIRTSARRAERADFLKAQFETLLQRQEKLDTDFGRTILEIKRGRYYEFWGHDRFTDWVKSSGVTYARAYYLMNIAKLLEETKTSDEGARRIGLKVLRHITTAPVEIRPDLVKELLEKPMISSAVRAATTAKVREARGGGGLNFAFWIKDAADVAMIEKAMRAVKANRNLTPSETLVTLCREYLEFVQ